MEAEADLWKALSHPVRRRLMDLVAKGSRTTGDLTLAIEGMSRVAVMQHLAVLRGAKLILVERRGRKRINHLNAVPIRRLYERWVNSLAGWSAAGLLTMQRHVETDPATTGTGGTSMKKTDSDVVEIEQEIRLRAPIEKVFAALTTDLDAWWQFRTRADSKIVFEPRVGGAMFEDWGGGRGVLYGNVTCYDPPARVCTAGVSGWAPAYIVSWHRLESDGDETVVRKSMQLFGQVPEDLATQLESGSRSVLDGQLRPFVEEGRKRETASANGE